MVKKIISKNLLVIMMLAVVFGGIFSVTGISAEANDEFVSKDGRFEYYLENNEAYVNYIGSEKDIVIPEKVDGYKVVHASAKDNETMESVYISEGIKGISDFNFCSTLKSVHLPNSLESIDYLTFTYCDNLATINIPANLKTIGVNAFQYCKKIKNSDLGKKILSYNDHAFGCQIENYYCKYCGKYAFEYTVYKEDVSISRYFGDEENVVVPETIEGYPVTTLWFWAKGGGTYGPWYTGIKTLTVPKTVTEISDFKNYWYKNFSYTADIIGYSDTYAEQFAKEEGLKFYPIDGVTYHTHVQSYGWQNWVKNGEMSGTSGEAKRLEGIEIKLENPQLSGGIEYRTHVQSYGWQNWKKDGAMSGTSGEAKRLEAIEIRLTGEMAKKYDVYYRVHAQSYGWLGWAKNGESAGTAGLAKRLEGIEIRLVMKGRTAPGSTANAFINGEKEGASVTYRTHVQSYGWQGWKKDGVMSGTSGEAKRLEGIEIKVDSSVSGNIEYRTHVQTYGWQDWKKNGAMSGTSGEAKRLEAIQIRLTGDLANKFDVYYRVHAQSYGWLGWAKNGENAGTAGYAKRLEGIEIRIVKKGSDISEFSKGGVSYIEKPVEGDSNLKLRQELVDLINEYKAEHANSYYKNFKFTLDDTLVQAADIRAKEIVTDFAHVRPNGSYYSTVFSEINTKHAFSSEFILQGYQTPQEVFNYLMETSGVFFLNENVMNKIGVGYYTTSEGYYGTYWTIIIAS